MTSDPCQKVMALFDVIRLEKWQKYQPISILSLDIPDRTVLRVAGMFVNLVILLFFIIVKLSLSLNL